MRRHVQWTTIIAAALLLLAAPAWSQDPAQLAKLPPDVRAGIQTDFMTQKLQLSAAQRTQVEAINLKVANQMQPLLEGSKWTLMREAGKVDAAKDDDLRAILDAQQFAKYQASKDELKALMQQKAAAHAAAD